MQDHFNNVIKNFSGVVNDEMLKIGAHGFIKKGQYFLSHGTYRNPSLGLAIKVKGCKVTG
jgi:hypothetical protein